MPCKYCGCGGESSKPCPGGCSWIKDDVCSSCVIKPRDVKGTVESYLSDPHVEEVEIIITRKNKEKEGFLVLE